MQKINFNFVSLILLAFAITLPGCKPGSDETPSAPEPSTAETPAEPTPPEPPPTEPIPQIPATMLDGETDQTEPEPSGPIIEEPTPSEPVISEPIPQEPVPTEPVPTPPTVSQPIEPTADTPVSRAPILPAKPTENDWPWWRGIQFDGHASPGQNPPLKWSETENIRWSIELPGLGHGTPCIWGDRIYLASADEEEQTITMYCYDRETGEPLWQQELHRGVFDHMHKDNSHATATAACDGESIFYCFQSDEKTWATAQDMKTGEIRWKKDFAPFGTVHGYASSPVIYKSTVIVVSDSKAESYLVAFDRRTGDVVWKTLRPDQYQNFVSPIVLNVAGRDQLLLTGPYNTYSYDPDTGEMIWKCEGPTTVAATTPVADQDTVYTTAGYPERILMAVRADGTGDVTETHRLWTRCGRGDDIRRSGYVPSPLLHDGLLYILVDEGKFRCHDPATGDLIWEHEFDAPFYSSPVLVDDRIYMFDREGGGYVFQAGRELKLIAENRLPEGAFATPVFLGDDMYLRTLKKFYRIGAPTE